MGGCFLFFTSCLEDREFKPVPFQAGTNSILRAGILKINEVQPDFNADSGDYSDWVELYNNSDSALILEPNRFWMTDNKDNKFSFTSVRSYSIPARGFLTVYFNSLGLDTSSKNIISNTGNLSKNGEFVGFYFLASNGDTITVDSLSFPASPAQSKSYARVPDGGFTFKWVEKITRNRSNNINLAGSGLVEPFFGILKINEIAPNETLDWVELASTLPDTFTMKSGRWFFTDDLAAKTKDTLKVNFIVAQESYNVVECISTSSGSTSTQLRTKLGLSSTNGEAFGIYYLNDSNELITIAEQAFPAGIESGKSYGRQPNLTGPFVSNITPSKGQANP